MLVLQRKPGERIKVGSTTISIAKVQGNRVSVGIDAPKDIAIYREEIAPRVFPLSLEDELAEALQLLLGSVTEADLLFPTTHQVMHVKIEHAARAQEALSKWRNGGAS
jgi:carbon storage regulator